METKMAVSFANNFMLKLKQRLYNRAKPSQKNGDDILTISSPSGTLIKKTVINLLNKLTNSTLPSNSQPNYQRARLVKKKSKACHSLTLSKFGSKMADCNKREAWALGASTLISKEEAHFHGGGSFPRRRLISTEEADFHSRG